MDDKTFLIQKQTEAEKDDYLIDCFYDAGFIQELVDRNFSIISGRKGAGKTALARVIENKAKSYNIDFAYRISIRNISITNNENRADRLNSILFFVIIKTVQRILSENVFSKEGEVYWRDLLIQNGLQNVHDYETFIESQKDNKIGSSLKGKISSLIASVGSSVEAEEKLKSSRSFISSTPTSLIEAIKETIPPGKTIFIILDDLSDYLDEVDIKKLKEDIGLIQDILLHLDAYNSTFYEAGKQLRFISCLREDLFEFMEGSNVNKLRNDSLHLEWDEKSFAGLLIRRLPFFQSDLTTALINPIESLRIQFPDEIFVSALETFGTNRYSTNFYAYMISISFNRPRDFLVFCYAMRERLSMKRPASYENIEAAEIEYSDYFIKELRDEMFLASKVLKHEFDSDQMYQLIDMLSQKDGFNPSQLRTDLGQYLGEKTSLGKKKIEGFIENLWWYGILGFKEEKEKIIHYRYVPNHAPFIIERIKDYIFFLHRGLWWFANKRKTKK